MTQTTQARTIAELDFALDRARVLAKAERAFTAVSSEPNPWSGACDRLAELEAELEAASVRTYGETLRAGLAQRAQFRADIDRASNERTKLEAELQKVESSDAILRYRVAPTLAARLGSGWNWTNYAQYLESGRSRPLTQNDVPLGTWPVELRFDDADRITIRRWRELQGEVARAVQAGTDSERRLRDLEAQFPEIGAV